MEVTSRPFNGRNYWKKNGYALLNGAAAGQRKIEVVHIDGRRKRRWLWRLRKAAKVAVRWTPRRLWLKFRDGYVNMMLRVAGNVGRLNGGSEFMGKRIAGGRKVSPFTRKKRVEDFEARLVLEIYKGLATSRGLSEL